MSIPEGDLENFQDLGPWGGVRPMELQGLFGASRKRTHDLRHKKALFSEHCSERLSQSVWTFLDGGNGALVIGFWSRPIWGASKTLFFKGSSEPRKLS